MSKSKATQVGTYWASHPLNSPRSSIDELAELRPIMVMTDVAQRWGEVRENTWRVITGTMVGARRGGC